MTTRPYEHHLNENLKELYQTSMTTPRVLLQIVNELEHRSSAESQTLKGKVLATLNRDQVDEKKNDVVSYQDPITNESRRVIRVKSGVRPANFKPLHLESFGAGTDRPTESKYLFMDPNNLEAITPIVKLYPELIPPDETSTVTKSYKNTTKAIQLESVMPLEEILAILEVKLESNWESVEQARVKIVDQSSPSETQQLSEVERTAKIKAAKKANHAFLSLLTHRAY